MNKTDIENFLDSRPAIGKSAFCREADITPQYLNMILREDRPLTDETAEKLAPVMKKYGWEECV